MTLSTDFVLGACEAPTATAEAVYLVCRELLGTPDRIEPKRGLITDHWLDKADPTLHRIDHPGGVGLPAWLRICYRPEGPAVVPFVPSEWADEDDREYHQAQPMNNGFGWCRVNWDTSYGYRGPNGESCSTLHAFYIAALGKWCDDRGIAWKWHDEYTGEWHDRFDGLREFSGLHDQPGGAGDWFTNVVRPAIAANGGTK